MTPALYEPERHEALTSTEWSESAVRRAIEAIATEAVAACDGARGWPVHPLDDEPAGSPTPMLYFGAAGVAWALDHLTRVIGTPALAVDPRALLASRVDEAASYAAGRMSAPGSSMMGACGVRLTLWKLTRSNALLDEIADDVERTLDHPANELLWGSPGAMLAAAWLHEETGEPRWRELFVRGVGTLLARLATCPSTPVRLWRQEMYGLRVWMLGAGHGLAGNAAVVFRGRALLGEERTRAFALDVAHTVLATAIVSEGRANWPRMLDPVEPAEHRDALAPERRLVQFCHGAPGFVIGLAAPMRGIDARFDRCMLEAGELVWSAGPLRKGAGICHGTAGNGYALLRLWDVTGDRRWLDRARAFAMHAIAQCEASRATYGRGRWSLWTGDLGTACFLADCIREHASFPTLDAFF